MTKKKHKPRASQAEVDERIGVALALIRTGALKHEIKRVIAQRWDVSARQIEDYLARARTILRAELDQSIEDHRADALGFYSKIVSDPKVPLELKLRARRRMDRILGIEQSTVNVNVNWQKRVKEAGLDPEEFRGAIAAIIAERTGLSPN